MGSWTDKYAMVAGEWLASGVELVLPIDQPWPEQLIWSDNNWKRVASSGFNVFRLMQVAQERNYSSPFWITLKDGEAAGGKLREDAEGVYCAAWRLSEKSEVWSGDIDAKHFSGDELESGLEDDADEAVAMRPYVLFNAECWDRLPELPNFYSRQIPTREEALERAQKLEAKGAGCEIRHEGATAYFNPSLNYIALPAAESYPSLRAYYLALFEQMGHALASRHQLDLWGGAVDAEMARDPSFKTMYAKMVAAMLAYEAGIDVLE